MTEKEIINIIAACGLECERCVTYAHGPVKKLSVELKKYLENFENFAPKIVEFVPAFKNYEHFKEILDIFANAFCNGCRAGGLDFPMCISQDCVKEKGVDFCYECDEFPCEKNKYPEELKQVWLNNNKRIKEIGIKAYYDELKSKPKY